MGLIARSSHLADDEFLSSFHSCKLTPEEFAHADHLRLAWLHLHRAAVEQALLEVRTGIRRFAEYHGAEQKYHETITAAWVRLLSTHEEISFDEFLERNQHRLSLNLLHCFWTPALLASEEAKLHWVEPDLMPLPCR